MPALRQFLEGFIDYAGLFPPASLDMSEAVRNYAEYREGKDRELLGRFVLPASRLDEFADSVKGLLGRGDGSVPWCLSVLVDGDAASARKSMLELTSSHMSGSDAGHALCEAVETRAVDVEQIKAFANAFSHPLRVFFEVSPDPGYERKIEAIAGISGSAKIRTGGITPDAFPSSESMISFIAACRRNRVPFKATAGLHHAICGTYPLTYERHSITGRMFGFLNLLLAAAFVRRGMSETEARKVLEASSADAFSFNESGVTWRESRLSRDDLRKSRSQLFLSFGSCSFVEPVNEARALGLV